MDSVGSEYGKDSQEHALSRLQALCGLGEKGEAKGETEGVSMTPPMEAGLTSFWWISVRSRHPVRP